MPNDLIERPAAAPLAGGTGEVAWCRLDTPIGPMLGAATPSGLAALGFPGADGDAVLDRLAATVSARVVESPARLDAVRRQLDEYFAGDRRRFELAIDWALVGPFARRVLAACAAVPYGEVTTYGELAAVIGAPGAARAVGNALGANPVPIVVPCHRVLRRGGALGGYGGGLDVKAQLLRLEGAAAR